MDETRPHSLSGHLFQVAARLAKTEAEHGHFADAEFAADQMIERDPAGHDVPPAFTRAQRDLAVASQRVDGFLLDQRELAVGAHPLRIGS